MSILFDKEKQTFTLQTRSTTYQLQIGPLGYLLHLYYGRRAEGCFDYLHLPRDCGFSANPYELQDNRGWSLDTMPQEYSGSSRRNTAGQTGPISVFLLWKRKRSADRSAQICAISAMRSGPENTR